MNGNKENTVKEFVSGKKKKLVVLAAIVYLKKLSNIFDNQANWHKSQITRTDKSFFSPSYDYE